jgi:Ser/Thr protein kinase RdoA (MazF antagonist)
MEMLFCANFGIIFLYKYMIEEIKIALQKYHINELEPITLMRESGDNFVYVIGEKDKKILRISKRLPVEDIKFEYEAIKHLSDGGMIVPKILTTKTGDFYTLINDNVAVLFDFLNGHHIEVDKDHFPTIIQAYNAGRGLGFMSNISSGFTSSSPRKRNIFSELDRAITFEKIFTEQFEGGKEFINQINEAITFGKKQNEIEGFIHNDYRPSNVFFDDKNEFAGIIDFDWSCNGPIIKDLALAVVEWSFPDGRTEPDFTIFDSFLDGYNSVANHKWFKNEKLYSWIKFTTLSDAATYFCDLAEDPTSTKRIIRSYMYRKFTYFNNILLY